jgi:hypothetical protein
MLRVKLGIDVHFAAGIVPNDFVTEVVVAKKFIHDNLDVMSFFPVQVHIYCAIWG